MQRQKDDTQYKGLSSFWRGCHPVSLVIQMSLNYESRALSTWMMCNSAGYCIDKSCKSASKQTLSKCENSQKKLFLFCARYCPIQPKTLLFPLMLSSGLYTWKRQLTPTNCMQPYPIVHHYTKKWLFYICLLEVKLCLVKLLSVDVSYF